MDKAEIVKLAHSMSNKNDILDLLNRIKLDDMAENGLADKFYPFTMKNINFYCNPNNTHHRYRQFKIKKKTGGFRQITAPRNRSFMQMLKCVNEIFKAIYSPSDYAMGFTEERSVVTNANVHKGQNYILNIDLKDFFPSIEQPRIWKRLQLKPFNFAVPVANVLAGLCSMKEMRTMDDGSKKAFYILPQGAPTSPVITNMICDTLDRRLAGLAKRFGLHYTRYADDITFSSMHNVYQKNGEFRKELLRIIQGQGFTINEKKTRLQKVGGRQEVTGIIVSNKLNVTHDYVRNIRNILYIWDRYGYGVAYAKFFPKYKEDKGHVKKGDPDLVNVIDGKLMYMKMVKGDEDSTYRRLHDKFENLVDDMRDPVKTTIHSITYVETTPLIEFEKKNNTEIVIKMSDTDEHSEKTIDDKTVKFHRYAYFLLNGKKVFASVSKDIKPDMEKQKEHLSISICRDKQDKPFWLVHLSNKVVMPSLVPVDVDELNKELDALLKL